MSLPDKSKLESIREAGNKDSSLGLPTSGYFWSSSERYAYFGYYMYFNSGHTDLNYKYKSNFNVLCIGD